MSQPAAGAEDMEGKGPGWRLGECGSLAPKVKYDMICELDAVVAHPYGLDEEHLRHVFETFHEGWGPGQTATHLTRGEYDERLRLMIRHFQHWRSGR